MEFLGKRAIPGVEAVSRRTYTRSVEIEGRAGMIEVCKDPDRDSILLHIRIPQPGNLLVVVERIRRIFDLSADPLEIHSQLSRDRRLHRFLSRCPGLRVPGAWDGFEVSVRAILGQHISVKAANKIAGRLVQRHGKRMDYPCGDGVGYLFPSAETLAAADISGLGLTTARCRTVGELARAVLNGTICFDSSIDNNEFLKRLTSLPGVGHWTGQYILMRTQRDPDAFPASDLGLLRAAADAGIADSEASLLREAESWRPWRSYAAMHLWMNGT
jgi:AraC family transcriptional regulator of adaptative response / DNA-3-methyladenine glycosylase II